MSDVALLTEIDELLARLHVITKPLTEARHDLMELRDLARNPRPQTRGEGPSLERVERVINRYIQALIINNDITEGFK